MLEDKLTRPERIRLECLAQSLAASPGRSDVQILERAKQFEAFVKGEEKK